MYDKGVDYDIARLNERVTAATDPFIDSVLPSAKKGQSALVEQNFRQFRT
jgi:hypothetical protein